MTALLLSKAFVEAYTRDDGTFVRQHFDRRPAAQPDLFPRKETGGDQAIALPYASGMSRRRDMAAAIQSTAGVGTVIDEISRPGMEAVADAIAAGKPFFVDSGAFQAFKAAMRERKPEKAMRDFDKVFARYDELSRLVCERAPSRLERGLLLMVAPDVIGDQTATLKLLEKHADQVNAWIERGHEVIIPFQRGPLSQSQVFKRAGQILGHHMFVVGIPTAAAALSNEELHELLSQPYKPERLHILGGVSSEGFHSRMAVIRGAYEDDVPGVTADANVMRSRLHELHGMSGQPKFEAIKRILNRVVPDIWGGDMQTGHVMHKAGGVERIPGPGEPTRAQLASGRYAKRKLLWKGLTLRIENEAGTFRRGRGPDGDWETLMHFAYGEVERTEGVDGDPVDVFLGPYMDTAPMVYVVHQRKVRDWDKYDEDKCMLGFESEADAVAAFLSSYSDPRFLGPVTAMPVDEFIAKAKATRAAPAMIKALMLRKAFVEGHQRRLADGRVVYIQPYVDRRLKHQPELFQDGPAAKRPDPEKVVFLKPSKAPTEQFDLFAPLVSKPTKAGADAAPDLASYDKVLVAFSGGKDSVAALLSLIEAGVPRDRIELHHHDIDGDGRSFMDWPITKGYVRAIAAAFGVPVYFSWREGGFEREMVRRDERTAAVHFETPEGVVRQAGGEHGPLGTRRKFPQVSADLKTRWCSGKLKIDVMDAAIRNQDRFNGIRTLVVTGERAEESANRAKYKTFEPHRAASSKRHIDQYRPVHGWKEQEVWDIIRRHGVVPHPAYQLGWGRLSCRTCIFGSPNQWSTIRELYPEHFQPIADYEKDFGVTIHRTEGVHQRADKGTPYQAALDQKELAAVANGHDWAGPVIVAPDQWKLPAGAFGEKDGPC